MTIIIHLPDGTGRTLCGKICQQISVRGVMYWRTRWLPVISPSQCVEEATCKACHRVDDSRAVKNYLRECREAAVDPDTLQPLPKAKP
jgi:hypothetical protein